MSAEQIDVPTGTPVMVVRRQWDIVLAVAVGGVIGAEARYGVGVLLPHHPGQFPWSTILINAVGCLLIGVLMVVVLERAPGPWGRGAPAHRLARPFLGVGILGGFTTFSTFAMDAQQLLLAKHPWLALAYVAATVMVCAVAVWLSTGLTRAVGRTRVGSER